MKRIILLSLCALLLLGAASAALAGEGTNYRLEKRTYMNSTGGMVYWAQYISPAAADTTTLVNKKTAYPTGTDTTYAVSCTMTYPRTVQVTVSDCTGANDAGIKDVDVVVTGTNYLGETITDTITPSSDTAGTTGGVKAFKTVVSVYVPKMDDSGALIGVGLGSKMGLPLTTAIAGNVRVWAGDTEEAAVTLAISATAIESNTWSSTTAFDGSSDYILRQEVPPFSSLTVAGSKW